MFLYFPDQPMLMTVLVKLISIKNEYQLSIDNYQKSLELEPANNNAKEMILKINQLLSAKK